MGWTEEQAYGGEDPDEDLEEPAVPVLPVEPDPVGPGRRGFGNCPGDGGLPPAGSIGGGCHPDLELGRSTWRSVAGFCGRPGSWR